MKKTTHQYIAFIFGLIFLLFAYFQINDPDPIIWIAIYLLASLVSFAFFFGYKNNGLLIFLCLDYLAGAIYFFPFNHFKGLDLNNFAMKAQGVEIEFARESFGLGICFLVMVYLLFAKK